MVQVMIFLSTGAVCSPELHLDRSQPNSSIFKPRTIGQSSRIEIIMYEKRFVSFGMLICVHSRELYMYLIVSRCML